jgi:TIR domain
MSPAMNLPVQNAAEPPPRTTLDIFISYVKEDASLVHDIAEELKKPFGLLLRFFIDSRSLADGDDFKKEINDRLDKADILLIVSTGQRRDSHDFPGYEIGFFSHSIRGQPDVAGIPRKIIPLVIGGKTPTAVLDIQGVIIGRDDILNFEVSPGNLSSEAKFLQSIADDNPFKKLLRQIRDSVLKRFGAQISDDDLDDLNKSINECAGRLYKKVFAYLQGRIYAESYPERKLILRTALPPLPLDEDTIIGQSTIEFVGQSFEAFGLPERPPNLTWQAFISAIRPTEISTQWKEGIRTLVSPALSGVLADNYYYVSTSSARAYRLFVSLIRTYYSGQKEIHIYIVELPPRKDSMTTKLVHAVSIGCKYRSLFLEKNSKFSPKSAMFWLTSDVFRSSIKEMWRELQQVLAEARQDRLDDPDVLRKIYGDAGHTDLDELAVVWRRAENDLNKIAHDALAADDAGIMAMKPAFMKGLAEFCAMTEQMNREFTAKALQALEADITQKLADDSPTQPKTAVA